MIFIFLLLLFMYFVRTNEVLVQILGKITLWVLIWTSFSLAAQAFYNRYIPWGERYQLPLQSLEIAAYTKTSLSTTFGVTRDNQGNLTGNRLDMTLRVQNNTDRVLDKVTVRCRYAWNQNDYSTMEHIPVHILPGSSETVQHTWKSRNGHGADAAYCYVQNVQEVDQWH